MSEELENNPQEQPETETPKSFKEQLTSFFEEYKPEKLKFVDEIAAKFDDKQDVVLRHLDNKYGEGKKRRMEAKKQAPAESKISADDFELKPKKKKSKVLLIIILLIVLGGGGAAGYFFLMDTKQVAEDASEKVEEVMEETSTPEAEVAQPEAESVEEEAPSTDSTATETEEEGEEEAIEAVEALNAIQ